MSGDESSAEAAYIIRDHDREKFEARKMLMAQTVEYMNRKYGPGTFTLQMTDSYYNMKEMLTGHMHLIRNAEAAMQKAGVTPQIVAIRGGTDGARLSHDGLPCPNLSTGGLNFHSIHEFIPIPAMEKWWRCCATSSPCNPAKATPYPFRAGGFFAAVLSSSPYIDIPPL